MFKSIKIKSKRNEEHTENTENTRRQNTSFPREKVENADLGKPV